MAKARAISGLDARVPVATNARLIVKARLEELYQWEDSVTHAENVHELHDMRIAAKRLRYTLEIFEEVLPAASKAIVNELIQLQDEIGEIHDSDVMIALLQMCLSSGQNGTLPVDAQVAHREEEVSVPADMAAYLIDPDSLPGSEQRDGLGAFLLVQEQLRRQRYNAFLQHWSRLQERDLRREVIEMLGE